LIGTNRRLSTRLVTKITGSGPWSRVNTAIWAVPDQAMPDIATDAAGPRPFEEAAAPKAAPHKSVGGTRGKAATIPRPTAPFITTEPRIPVTTYPPPSRGRAGWGPNGQLNPGKGP